MIFAVLDVSLAVNLCINCSFLTFILSRDGKEPSLLGFGSVRVLTKVRVRFSSSSSQVHKIWVRFGFGYYILSFEFGSVLFYISSAV